MQGDKRDDPIFPSVSAALHFVFFLQAVQPSVRVGTEIAIEAMRYRAGKDAERAARAINFSGLNQNEIRATCQMVRNIVERKLPPPERNVVWARHGWEMQQMLGVQGLTEYLDRIFVDHRSIAFSLVFSMFKSPVRKLPGQKSRIKELSLRDIERDYHVPRSTLHDLRTKASEYVTRLEHQAEGRLDPYFREHGIVGERVEEGAAS